MSTAGSLTFAPVRLEDYERLLPYTAAYGEGSCQHSSVSMFSLAEKYGDTVCESEGFLYTLRTHLCDETYRVYLAPLGGGDLAGAFSRVVADAARHGKRVKFVSLTTRTAEALKAAFPGRFDYTERPDLAEYMYRTEIMGTFSGPSMKKRRTEIHAFRRMFGDRAAVTRICPEDTQPILEYEEKWLVRNKETHDTEALEREARMIGLQMAHFDALHLSGIVVRIDGEIVGFGYGTKLSERFYDAIVEKGDRDVPHLYKILRMESVAQCAMDCTWVNMEEDVGLTGLKALKMAYRPDYLLQKYVVTERERV